MARKKKNNTLTLSKQGSKKGNGKTISLDKSAIKSLAVRTTSLTQKDIRTWRSAHQMALNVENPRRSQLYNVYDDTLLDNHLIGCIEQRKNKTRMRKFKLVNKEGVELENVTEIFSKEWFYDFIDLALDSHYWGHSLILLGEIIEEEGVRYFEDVELIPRRHVVPEFGVIIEEEGDEPQKGHNYRKDKSLSSWTVEVGGKKDLGLLLNCAKDCISKKQMLSFWDNFGELFGAPMRLAKMGTNDRKERDEMENYLRNQGMLSWLVTGSETEVEIKGNDRSDAYLVYDKRIERCNSEISKAILVQTMTIDNGSSRSQSETHLDVFLRLCEQDAVRMAYVVNDKLIPRMIKIGFKQLEGIRFEWDDSEELTPAEIREVERLLLQHYDIEAQYFIDKYNIPVKPKAQTQGKEKQSLMNGGQNAGHLAPNAPQDPFV